MKTKILNLTIGLLLIASFSIYGQEVKTETFKVLGNCGMCKTRIENAAKSVNGVSKADWNEETKIVEVSFDASKVKVDDIHNAIAKVGHDTEKVKANVDVYNALPGCCQYERELK